MNKLDHWLSLVEAQDHVAIEGARDDVTPDDIPALIDAYWHRDDWVEKGLLINLMQDYLDPNLQPVMLDFLRAPSEPTGDFIEVTKAIALCHLDGDFNKFTAYYDDRQLLERVAQQYLSAQKGGPPPKARKLPSSEPGKKWWQLWKR
jgi:hypothetical protein